MRNTYLLLFAFICFSYNRIPTTVTTVLQQSGSNRKELDSVIAYYERDGNTEKLQAAYYLIGNMGDKFSYDGDEVKNYDCLFNIIDSLRKTR